MKNIINILLLTVYIFLLTGYGVSELTHEIMHALPEIHSHEHESGHHVEDHHALFNQLGEIDQESDSPLELLPFLTMVSYVSATGNIITDCSIYVFTHRPYVEGQSQHCPNTPHQPPLV